MIKKLFNSSVICFFLFMSSLFGEIRLIKFMQDLSKKQPYMTNGLFYNSKEDSNHDHFIDALAILKATWAPSSWSNYYDPVGDFDGEINTLIQHDQVKKNSNQLEIQWIGHATMLIQVNGFNIITDPVFYNVGFLLYPRKTPLGIETKNLPKIDFVLISHNHHDHLDVASMKVLVADQPIMLVPMGLKYFFTAMGFEKVYESNWWDEYKFARGSHDSFKPIDPFLPPKEKEPALYQKNIAFTFLPAHHWSKRSLTDAHTSLWGGWLVRANDQTLYFSGDTAWDKENFELIKSYASEIDCALLQIGPCEPRQYMKGTHISPEEAVNAWKILNAKLNVPIHWGTFRLGPDRLYDPIFRAKNAWDKLSEPKPGTFYVMKFGERLNVKEKYNQKNR